MQGSDERKSRPVRWQRAALICWLASIVLAFSLNTAAQEQPSDSVGQDPTPAATEPNSADSQNQSLPDPGVMSTLDTGQKASQGSSRASPLQWGHLSLSSFDAFYDYDSNYRFAATNPQAADAMAARLLFLYSVGNAQEALNVQYKPFLFISQNDQEVDLTDVRVDAHKYRRLSTRWITGVNEVFAYSPDRGSFIDATIAPDFSTGAVTQDSFLANGFKELRNGATGFLGYRIALHDTVGFHAQYEFIDLINKFAPQNPVADEFRTQNTIGGGIGWAHEFSESRDFGVQYNYDRGYVGGFEGRSQFHSVMFTYGQRIQPTLLLRLSAGPSLEIYDNGRPNYRTVRASVEVLKTFHRSRLGGLYSRDYNYTGVISNGFHDRFDALYSRTFGPRWDLSGGGGYVINNSTFSPQVRGRDLWIRGSHRLSASWGLYASFGNSASSGGLRPYAPRSSVVAGVHWSYQPE